MRGWWRLGVGVVALVVTALGCAGGYSSADRLQLRVDQFNNSIRWGQYYSAAELVQPEVRARWLAEHRRWAQGGLRIADYEVVDSTEQADGTTTVRVVVSWYRLNQGEIQTTLIAQRWRRLGREWQLVAEEVEEGTPL